MAWRLDARRAGRSVTPPRSASPMACRAPCVRGRRNRVTVSPVASASVSRVRGCPLPTVIAAPVSRGPRAERSGAGSDSPDVPAPTTRSVWDVSVGPSPAVAARDASRTAALASVVLVAPPPTTRRGCPRAGRVYRPALPTARLQVDGRMSNSDGPRERRSGNGLARWRDRVSRARCGRPDSAASRASRGDCPNASRKLRLKEVAQ